jgi:hypothetical protein
MTRSKLQVTVFANTHGEMIKKTHKAISEYLEISKEHINDHVDIEIEIKGTEEGHEFDFVGTAYVRIK